MKRQAGRSAGQSASEGDEDDVADAEETRETPVPA
jgi:hypothetical protein